jgi:uncharacterized protein YgiM (DUF1202 family)
LLKTGFRLRNLLNRLWYNGATVKNGFKQGLMNTEKNKNLTPTRTTFQAKSAPTGVSLTKSTSKKTKSPWRIMLFILFLLVAAAGGWVLLALNRPGIEIKSGATAHPSVSAQAQLAPASRTASTQATLTTAITGTVSVTNSTGTGTPGAPTPTLVVAKNQSQPQIQGYGVVTSKVLNMRSAPNTDATVIKSLKNGDIVELASRSGGWYQTIEGWWVSASYMEVRQTRPEAESYARELASS